jgi:hypothetical protein
MTGDNFCGGLVQHSHGSHGGINPGLLRDTFLNGSGDNAGAKRLSQQQAITSFRAAVRKYLVGMNQAGDRIAELGFVIVQFASIILDNPPARIFSKMSRSPFSGKQTKAIAVSGRPPIA